MSTRSPIRSSGHLRPPTAPEHADTFTPYGADTLAPLRQFRGATVTASRRQHVENVSWCATCHAVDNVGTCCPNPVPTGATLPAVLDGPRATAPTRRTVRAATDGTGATVKPDVTPATVARGGWSTRTTAKRADSGKVTVRRLSVHGRHRLLLNGHRAATYDGRESLLPMATRDGYAVARLNADGTTPKAVGATAHRATARRRSRAAIIGATAPATLATPATADAVVTADAVAMLATGAIG